ncbi:MAG: hypothetical protein WC449_04820 [Candidatus Paceibacterota bacterium]
MNTDFKNDNGCKHQIFSKGNKFVKDGRLLQIYEVYHDGKNYLYDIDGKLMTASQILGEYTLLIKIE